MRKLKGSTSFSIQIIIGTIIAIAISMVVFAGVAGAVEGQADQASCTGWLRPIASTLGDLVDVDLC